ncbi:uncharacterized protein N7515_010034 [Penicillium bovifimosum]|uniref:Uncharacterized protein n=1 Tax=Penicillium bovifimosum TaxID=126998 RepID=A0A9W9GI29_9EURO|nr:uncharacterized protein N7515_010034 [Penicillium bovifimosum]KAJ5120646.1 hypothetical protein N7515_010034 [Penicillium bovifimosum]
MHQVNSPHTQASIPDDMDTEDQYMANQVSNSVRGRPRNKRKRSNDIGPSETGESECDSTTTEYNAGSYSSDGIDDSEPSSLPRAKRGKRSSAKDDDYYAQPKTTKAKQRTRKLSDSIPHLGGADFPNGEDQSGSSDEEKDTIKAQRRARNKKFAREREQRLLQIGKLTKNDDLSPDEQRTAHQLLTRGTMPTIYKHWQLDFPTVADAVFFSGEDRDPRLTETHFVLETDKGTEFDAIIAFRDLLEICGRVKDCCNILKISPYECIVRTIRRYLTWAMRDARIRAHPNTTPVHIIYCKKEYETPKAAIDHVAAALAKLAEKWRSQLGAFHDNKGFWPVLIGIVVYGPGLVIIGLDTNPQPHCKSPGVRFLGQVDFMSSDSDIWSTLGVAIVIKHIQRTMIKLAMAYNHPFVAPILDESTKAMDDHDPDL